MKGSIGSYWARKPAGLDHDLCPPSQGSSWVLGKAALAEGRAFPGEGSNGKPSVLGVVSAEIRGVGVFWHQEKDRGDRSPEKALMCFSVCKRERGVCDEWACLP